MEKSRAEIEKMIIDFLYEHGEQYFTCALATCMDNKPRCTPVDARNDGLTMYFVADPGARWKTYGKPGGVPCGVHPGREGVYEKCPRASDVGQGVNHHPRR